MLPNSKIYVAGHSGMVGAAISQLLKDQGYTNLVERSSGQLDLRSQDSTENFFSENRPEYVFVAAAKVGGIMANSSSRADFMYDNLMIEANIIHAAWKYGVKKLLFLGSSCIYPKYAPQPVKEEYLLTGTLEPTNEPYAIAKIAGIKLCEAYRAQYGANFISVMPTNLYGKGDNYDPQNSHVLPAMIRKFHEAKISGAKEVVIWGTGTPRREFLYADDLADACLFLMENYNEGSPINIGAGKDITIAELARLIKTITEFEGAIVYDPSKPDGTPRKLLDLAKLNSLGWKYRVGLEQGIRLTYTDFLNKRPRGSVTLSHSN
jgi:GDP-L-fucose synthase